MDIYSLHTKRRGASLFADPKNIYGFVHILGQRIRLNILEPFFFNEEFAYQFGSQSLNNTPHAVSAYILNLDFGTVTKIYNSALIVRAMYFIASGDSNPNDNIQGGFVSPFHNSQQFTGFSGLFTQLRNIEKLGAGISFKSSILKKPFSLSSEVFHLNRFQWKDTNYPIVPNYASRDLGLEWDNQFAWEPMQQLQLQAGLAWLNPGAAYQPLTHHIYRAFLLAQVRLE